MIICTSYLQIYLATHPRLSVMFEGQPVNVSPALLRPPAPAMSLVLSRGWGGWGPCRGRHRPRLVVGGGGSVARNCELQSSSQLIGMN